MKWSRIKFSLNEARKIDFWKCFYKYFRGLCRYTRNKYEDAIKDFDWIINNGHFIVCESSVYEMLGICYSNIDEFGKAEFYLEKAREFKDMQKDAELFQWLGYVYFAKYRHEDAIECFRKAHKLGQKGIYRWIVNQDYVKDNIIQLDRIIKEKYKNIFPNI